MEAALFSICSAVPGGACCAESRFFPFSVTNRDFSRLPRQIAILETIREFVKFSISVTNRVFSFKSAGKITNITFSISIWNQLRSQLSECRYGLRKSNNYIRLIVIKSLINKIIIAHERGCDVCQSCSATVNTALYLTQTDVTRLNFFEVARAAFFSKY